MADYNPFSYYYYNIIIDIIIDIIHISNENIHKTEKIFTPNNPQNRRNRLFLSKIQYKPRINTDFSPLRHQGTKKSIAQEDTENTEGIKNYELKIKKENKPRIKKDTRRQTTDARLKRVIKESGRKFKVKSAKCKKFRRRKNR
jgi:hypothetical protein